VLKKLLFHLKRLIFTLPTSPQTLSTDSISSLYDPIHILRPKYGKMGPGPLKIKKFKKIDFYQDIEFVPQHFPS